jgi:SAM-dependent methyltransferase
MSPAEADRRRLFADFFATFPWHSLPRGAQGLALARGAPELADLVAERGFRIHKFDPTSADPVDTPFDFGYALEALQAEADPAAALRACARRLRPGAPFLAYLCYALDNRPRWYRALWRGSAALKTLARRQPPPVQGALAAALAAGVYWPAATAAARLERLGVGVDAWPLASHRSASFSSLRAHVEARLGAAAEPRYRAEELQEILRAAGLERVTVSDRPPFWTALAYKAPRG